MLQKYCKEKRENRLRKRVIVETLELNTAMQDGVYTIQVAHTLAIGAPAHHNNTQRHTIALTNTHQIKN
jgi:hypothetical protein